MLRKLLYLNIAVLFEEKYRIWNREKILLFLTSFSSFIKSRWQRGVPWLFLDILPYHPSLLVDFIDYNQCLYRFDVCRSLLVGQPWRIHRQQSIREYTVFPYFISSASHVLFVFLWWFVRWKLSEGITSVLRGVAQRFVQAFLLFLRTFRLSPGGATIK